MARSYTWRSVHQNSLTNAKDELAKIALAVTFTNGNKTHLDPYRVTYYYSRFSSNFYFCWFNGQVL